jgi:acyl-coenzyme A thioesterase PaaI-like protein
MGFDLARSIDLHLRLGGPERKLPQTPPRPTERAACIELTYSSFPSALSLEERRPSGKLLPHPGQVSWLSDSELGARRAPIKTSAFPCVVLQARWRLPRSLDPPLKAARTQWRDRAGFSPASLLARHGHPKAPRFYPGIRELVKKKKESASGCELRYSAQMTFLQRMAQWLGPRRLLWVMRFYPPYLGAGIRVRNIDPSLRSIEVVLPLRPWTRNFVGTQFGGSLYSMCDPFFMLLVMMRLGPEYTVWDKSARIDFLKPGMSAVRARFEVSDDQLQRIKDGVERQGKVNPVFEVTVTDFEGEPIARVTKTLSVRKRNRDVSLQERKSATAID